MTTEDMKEQRSGAELPWELWKLISRRTALMSGKKQLYLSKRHSVTAPSSFTCPTDPALAKQLGFVRAKRPHPCVCLPLKSIFSKGLCWCAQAKCFAMENSPREQGAPASPDHHPGFLIWDQRKERESCSPAEAQAHNLTHDCSS